ncbi:diaminopimelate epimerase [Rummeliibacillus pycnus]|uniref:diaminopimelate epimerase n=1 Tax=Rummeliibacillus pycnus TaxID=101070 RepID=UPI003D29F39E
MLLNLLKVHGSGNTFYLYETNDETLHNWVNLTKWLCNFNNHGGADGLLLVAPSDEALAKMRVINADGTEASMCGNGLRCVARYVLEKNGVNEGLIETMKATLHVAKEEPLFDGVPTYGVEIAPVSFELSSLPMNVDGKTTLINEIYDELSNDVTFTAVSVPNPHLISFVSKEKIENTEHQEKLATSLNSPNPICPDGVNVSYAYPISNHEIYVRTFERGVGFTNACGTAMTASALVSRKLNFTSEEKITVFNPGGFVQCLVQQDQNDYKLKLVGNATFIATYILEVDGENYSYHEIQETNEQHSYNSFIKYATERLASQFTI